MLDNFGKRVKDKQRKGNFSRLMSALAQVHVETSRSKLVNKEREKHFRARIECRKFQFEVKQ